MEDPFKFNQIKILDDGMMPYGCYMMINFGDDDHFAEIASECIKKLISQVKGAEKKGIIPFRDSMEIVIKRNPNWMSMDPRTAFGNQGTAAIKYYGRKTDERETGTEEGSGTE